MNVLVVLLTVAMAMATTALADDAARCQATKNKVAGKYASCRQSAVAKAVLRGSPPDYARCDSQAARGWGKAESSGGFSCPTNGNFVSIQNLIGAHSATVAAFLSGAGGPTCGDNAINVAGEQCDGSDLGGASCASLGFVSGALTCTGSCLLDASNCLASTTFPASGQTTSYGIGSDGNLQPGATLSFTDNRDGTITDNNTGLMWEKKDDSGGLHDKDNKYTWGMTSSPYTMNGTVVTNFLNVLNDVIGGGANCFAGHCDWRLPSIKELLTIVDFQIVYPGPAVPSAFHTPNCAGCTDITIVNCSCTASSDNADIYWSSTTYRAGQDRAWYVKFAAGDILHYFKNWNGYYARAVRGGL